MSTAVATPPTAQPKRSSRVGETLLFRGSTALIGLHVLDDNFLQPQPGTSIADHLVSGLVLLALLALAAWAYPLLRPGYRGLLALVMALPALLSGVEAIHYGREVGLSGDDYTGLLAMGTAPLLLGLGAVTLWRSRRTGDRLYRRYSRRLLKFAAAVVVTPLIAMPVAIAYVGSHAARTEVPPAQLGTAYEDVKLETSDGLELEGWYVPSQNGAAVIVFPGRSGTRKQARMLADNGYGVLLYDRRGEGASEGDPNGWGWDFDKDIKAGIDFLQQREDVEPGRIGGLGLSVGGEMLLQTAAEDTDLAAVVSEGAGARTVAEEVSDAEGLEKASTFLTLPRARCRERGLLEPGAAAAPEGADPEDRAPAGPADPRRQPRRRNPHPRLLPGRARAQADLAGARRRPHRRNRRTTERVRAPRRRLPRRRAARPIEERDMPFFLLQHSHDATSAPQRSPPGRASTAPCGTAARPPRAWPAATRCGGRWRPRTDRRRSAAAPVRGRADHAHRDPRGADPVSARRLGARLGLGHAERPARRGLALALDLALRRDPHHVAGQADLLEPRDQDRGRVEQALPPAQTV